jgi:hypothetical protein
MRKVAISPRSCRHFRSVRRFFFAPLLLSGRPDGATDLLPAAGQVMFHIGAVTGNSADRPVAPGFFYGAERTS